MIFFLIKIVELSRFDITRFHCFQKIRILGNRISCKNQITELFADNTIWTILCTDGSEAVGKFAFLETDRCMSVAKYYKSVIYDGRLWKTNCPNPHVNGFLRVQQVNPARELTWTLYFRKPIRWVNAGRQAFVERAVLTIYLTRNGWYKPMIEYFPVFRAMAM